MNPALANPPERHALAKSLALHVVLLALLVFGHFIHLPTPQEPHYIQAVMLAPRHVTPPRPVTPPPVVTPPPQPVTPPQAKPTPPPPVAAKHKTPLPTVEHKKAIAQAQPKPMPQPPRPIPAPKPAAKPAPQPKPRPAPPKPVINQQDVSDEMNDIDQLASQAKAQQRAQQLQQLQQEAAASVKALSARANRQIVLEYSRKINAQVSRNWIRPLSARNGMTAVLNITLQPGGDVETVVVEQSSGDTAFDNAAVAAVWKASPLAVPDDPDVFNSNFRPLHLKFKPTDL